MEYLNRWSEIRDEPLGEEILDRLIDTAVHFGIVEDTLEARSSAREDPRQCAENLRRNVFKGPGPGTWHGQNIWKLVEAVGPDFHHGDRFDSGTDYLKYLYRLVYGAASAEIHPSPRAVSQAIEGRPGESMKIEIGPDPSWTLPVISTAFPFVYWTFEVLDRHEALDLGHRMSSVMEEFESTVRQHPDAVPNGSP